jgi:hypothetical protein
MEYSGINVEQKLIKTHYHLRITMGIIVSKYGLW